MDYIGPTFTINHARVTELGQALGCNLRFELNDQYNLLVIVDDLLVTTFSMTLAENHIGVMQLHRPIDIHEEYVLAVMLIVRMMVDRSTVLTTQEAELLETFKEVMSTLKEYIHGTLHVLA